jgi:hypothetical protein
MVEALVLVDYRKPNAAVALANAVQRQMVAATELRDRGLQYRDDIGVLNRTDATAILAGLVETYGLRRKAGAPPPVQTKEDYLMAPEDANKVIGFLSAAHGPTADPEAQAEFHRLANELRKASGQPVQ